MKGINYLFVDFAELISSLEENDEERILELPGGATGVKEGDWVLAAMNVVEESLAVAACCVDRGEGLELSFQERDWNRLWRFAQGQPPLSVPPSMPPPAFTGSSPDASGQTPPAAQGISAPKLSSASESTLPPKPCAETLSPPCAHILHIDQDLGTQEVVQGLLKAGGYTVTSVPSAEHAFDALRLNSIDLVILEASLPGMSGIDFCCRMRRDSRLGSLPLVVLSTISSAEEVVKAFSAGADDYVAKPFRAPELSARVCGLLRRARMPAHAG